MPRILTFSPLCLNSLPTLRSLQPNSQICTKSLYLLKASSAFTYRPAMPKLLKRWTFGKTPGVLSTLDIFATYWNSQSRFSTGQNSMLFAASSWTSSFLDSFYHCNQKVGSSNLAYCTVTAGMVMIPSARKFDVLTKSRKHGLRFCYWPTIRFRRLLFLRTQRVRRWQLAST